MGFGRISGPGISAAGFDRFRTRQRDFSPQRAERNSRPSSQASSATASTKIVRDTSSIKLQLKTAEGDTVEISIDAQRLRQTERGFAHGAEGHIRQTSTSGSSKLTASVNVTGDLNEEELGDIQKLLASLASGEIPEAGEGEFDTVSGYSFRHKKTQEVSRSTVQLYG